MILKTFRMAGSVEGEEKMTVPVLSALRIVEQEVQVLRCVASEAVNLQKTQLERGLKD
jgi:hypothetical protein